MLCINKQVFWADDPSKVAGANLEMISRFNVRQVLAVPLLGSQGQVLGMFGVLDQRDGAGISQEDIRSAKALAAQVAVALEATRNLHLSEQHRRRAESLMKLALELNSQLRLPEFAKSFVTRAADLLGAKAAALALRQDSVMETLALQPLPSAAQSWSSVRRRFDHAITAAVAQHPEAIVSSSAAGTVGPRIELGTGLE